MRVNLIGEKEMESKDSRQKVRNTADGRKSRKEK